VPTSHVLTRAEAAERARLVDDVRYEVALDLAGDGPEAQRFFDSRTVVRFRCEAPGAATFIDLAADEVRAATLNGAPVAAAQISGGRIRLEGLAQDNVLEVEARCAYERTGVGLHRFEDPVDGAVYLHTQFEPYDAHRVYACFDQPDLKASFTLEVTAPAGWTVVSNGDVARHEDAADGGPTRWAFATTGPMPTYITALVAGPFHVVRSSHTPATPDATPIPLGLYCRRSLARHLDADEIFEITRQGFDYFARTFDTPYAWGKYDQLFVPEFNFGAMENTGCVTFSEAYIFRSKVTDTAHQSRASTILHEMAHMWFGNLVTMRWWDDLWLNESFATYIGTRALAEATRFRSAWASFANTTKAWALAQDQLPSTHPISADIADTDAIRTHFDGITYAKGASVLSQLVEWVGDDAFFSGLRGYFDRHAFDNATLADFLAALAKSSGRDLGEWSREWLETAGVATLRPDLAVGDDERYTQATLVQEAPEAHPTLRRHRLALGAYEHAGERLRRREQVRLDVSGPRTALDALVGRSRPDLLLVNDDDLTFAKVRLDEHSVATLVAHLSGLADPLARAVAWGSCWDMTRDAELPARRWVELVARHAATERECALLESLLGRGRVAADRYGAPDNRAAARARLAEAGRANLAAAEPGGDLQLAWLRHLIAVGDGEDHTLLLLGLLDGRETVTGLDIDTDLRWQVLTRLAADGAADEERIAAELERDPTDMGVRRAAAARACRPGGGAKQHAWQALLEQRDLPLATLRTIAAAFWQHGQDGVLRGYVERFPEALEAAWRDRVIEESIALTAGCYPSTIIDPEVVAMADAVLAREDLPRPARRTVLEARDATVRALQARAADSAARGA
jgi:aminopeptidase N